MSCKFLENGFELKQIDTDDRPDICVKHNGKSIWIECYLPSPPNKSKLLSNITTNSSKGNSGVVNFDANIACCTTAIYEKCRTTLNEKGEESQYMKWKSKGTINDCDIFILAINGINLLIPDVHRKSDVAQIAYPVGQFYASIPVNREPENIDTGYEHQQCIEKVTGKKVKIDRCFFSDSDYAHLSGILYSKDWYQYNPISSYMYLPNVFAKNPLTLDLSFFSGLIEQGTDNNGPYIII